MSIDRLIVCYRAINSLKDSAVNNEGLIDVVLSPQAAPDLGERRRSLQNAVKHSKAKNINVQMVYELDRLKLVITDDGVGFDPNALSEGQAGIGLKSMQNRVALIGGVFAICSRPGNGTVIIIELSKS